MTLLIKSDFRKFFKDKMFLVVCILAVGFAAITPLLYQLLLGGMGEVDPMVEDMVAGYVTAKGQFFGAFSFGNNLGLVAPLLIGIILFKDFSYGTVRNKIISGHTRTNIFLSTFVVCSVAMIGIIFAHALLTLGFSLPFFDYQAEPFVVADFWYLLESLGFELLVYLFASAFVSWLCATRKNVGMVIVMYIAIVLGCTMVAGILQIVIVVLQSTAGSENTIKILEFVQRINIFNSSATIGMGSAYSLKDTLYYVIPPVATTIALIGHGIYKFNRKDLK